ncbi:5-(carboxyamino)imidazole ribonucleotide synthase [Gaopeijia maritima]|uniref:N5-carboxyaminoimidazole ribonucleotide synthase n=1 Tax=Gaopeijia maritima TaxID=3119007 RepID=A0ABU9EDG4_9BACT
MNVGVLGGGQLGRMLALAGVPLGARFRFLEHRSPAPVDGLGEVVRAPYDDADALARFRDGLEVGTYEFENVPDASARALADAEIPVYPPPAALEFARDRKHEKDGFGALGIPTAPWRAVDDRASFDAAVEQLGLPAMLKTRRLGYDGKGQRLLRSPADLDAAWAALGDRPLVLEGFVEFSRELSIVGVRGRDGETAFYPLVENTHASGVLVRTDAPAPGCSPELQRTAERYAGAVMRYLDYVGVLALELFQVGDELWANEMAPRVHNSGHWTQNGAVTSQFENHMRAVMGLPLGSTEPVGHSVMLNLLGALPPAEAVLAEPMAHLHLYDKAPRPGRKIGHVNVCGPDREAVRDAARRIERTFPDGAGPA